jgi:iron complex outermembrane recepter protein
VLDAVTQNATGFTASPAPDNGSLAFNTRGFTGDGTVMTLYHGTRLYVGAGT